MLKFVAGFNIKALREHKGMSQTKLANDSKITAAYLCELENGVKTNPSIEVLTRIAVSLNVSVINLLDAHAKAVGE